MIARVILVLVFALSATTKAVDLHGAGAILGMQLGLGLRIGVLLAAGLIVTEAAASTALVVSPTRRTYVMVLLLVLALLGGSIVTLIAGWKDCGCFGTIIPLSPRTTVLKNLLLAAVATSLVRSGPTRGSGPTLGGTEPAR